MRQNEDGGELELTGSVSGRGTRTYRTPSQLVYTVNSRLWTRRKPGLRSQRKPTGEVGEG